MTYTDKEEKFWRGHIKSRRITDEDTLSFKIKPMGDEKMEAAITIGDVRPSCSRATATRISQAAQLDGVRQVMRWGIEQCQEHYKGGGVCSKRECPKCWQSLLKELGVEK